ncbi:hypothetical protein DFH07DRAFT_735937, partial [Mycena maculata]
DTGEATSEESFRFDVLGTPNSPWNKSAARVFAELAIRHFSFPNTVEQFDGIRHAFTAHLKTIRKRYQTSLASGPQRGQQKRLDRLQTRKYQLFHRRRYLVYTFKPFQRHIDMIEQLGIDGMSSDESDREDIADGGHTKYRVLAPRWRAGCVTPWLRTIDSTRSMLHKSGDSDVRGSFPRHRIPTNRKSTSTKFVSGLPLNAYDPEWIAADARRKFDLRPLAQHYDFSHDADVAEYVNILEAIPF